MAGINRFTNRKVYAQVTPLTMDELTMPAQTAAATKKAQQEAWAKKTEELGLDLNALDKDFGSQIELTRNYNNMVEEATNLYNSGDVVGGMMKIDEANNYSRRIASEQGEVFDRRRKLVEDQRESLKEMYGKGKIDEEDYNYWIKQDRLEGYLSDLDSTNPFEYKAPNITGSYRFEDDMDMLDKSMDNMNITETQRRQLEKDLSMVIGGSQINPDGYGNYMTFSDRQGITGNRIKAAMAWLNNPDRINKMNTKYKVLQEIGKLPQVEDEDGNSRDVTFEEYVGKINNQLVTTARGQKEGSTAKYATATIIDDIKKSEAINQQELLGINANTTVEHGPASTFQGGVITSKANQDRIKSLTDNIKSFDNILHQYEAGEITDGRYVNLKKQRDMLARNLEMAKKVEKDILGPGWKNNKAYTDALKKWEETEHALANTSVANPFGLSAKKFENSSIEEILAMPDNGTKPQPEDYIVGAKERLEGYSDVSRTVSSYTKGLLPGVSATTSKVGWETATTFFSNIGEFAELPLYGNGIDGAQTLSEYMAKNGLVDSKSEEYQNFQEAFKLAAKNVKLSTHPTLSDEGVWIMKVALPKKGTTITNDTVETIDIMISTEHINNAAVKAITNTPLWEFQGLASTAVGSGLDEYTDTYIKENKGFGDWKYNIESNGAINTVEINGMEFGIKEAETAYMLMEHARTNAIPGTKTELNIDGEMVDFETALEMVKKDAIGKKNAAHGQGWDEDYYTMQEFIQDLRETFPNAVR